MFPSFKIYAKILAGFILLLVVFAIVAVINIRQININEANSVNTVKSEQILQNSALLQRSIVDMQAGVRGYVLTGLSQLLTPYYVASSTFDRQAAAQRERLTNPKQIEIFDSITHNINYYINSIASPLIENKTRQLNSQEAERSFGVFQNESAMLVEDHELIDRTRRLFRRFDMIEYDQRLQSRSNLVQSFAKTKFLTFMLLLVAIVIGLITALTISRSIRTRIRTLSFGINRIAEGNYDFKLDENVNDELNKLTRAVNSMSVELHRNFSQLKHKNEELEQFAWVASHDLREPLRMVSIYIQKLQSSIETKLTEEEKENIDFIITSVNRMNDMIKGLLEYGRISQTAVVKDFHPTHELITNAVENLRLKIEEQDAKIIIDESVPSRIKGVGVLLTQLFQNLIHNALKFSADGRKPVIKIKARYEGNHWTFEVKDNGIGIDKEYQERVFALFQRLHDQNKYEGTGIGLSLCKKIVEMHEGSIWMESKPGDGTSIYFTLPFDTVMVMAG